MKKQAVVVHSGGMDSSLCLALAAREFSPQAVLSLTFIYQQRHGEEVERARKIAADWGIDHVDLKLDFLGQITESALIGKHLPIQHTPGTAPNTLVMGRNGLMARIAGIHAQALGARCIYLGVMELEEANSGYRDCNRAYMNLIEAALRLDFADDKFEIRTPLIKLNKLQSLEMAAGLGVLSELVEHTISCYEGVEHLGCGVCPACLLRNKALKEYALAHPEFRFSYRDSLLKAY